jgi:hypothetical protein
VFTASKNEFADCFLRERCIPLELRLVTLANASTPSLCDRPSVGVAPPVGFFMLRFALSPTTAGAVSITRVFRRVEAPFRKPLAAPEDTGVVRGVGNR